MVPHKNHGVFTTSYVQLISLSRYPTYGQFGVTTIFLDNLNPYFSNTEKGHHFERNTWKHIYILRYDLFFSNNHTCHIEIILDHPYIFICHFQIPPAPPKKIKETKTTSSRRHPPPAWLPPWSACTFKPVGHS